MESTSGALNTPSVKEKTVTTVIESDPVSEKAITTVTETTPGEKSISQIKKVVMDMQFEIFKYYYYESV